MCIVPIIAPLKSKSYPIFKYTTFPPVPHLCHCNLGNSSKYCSDIRQCRCSYLNQLLPPFFDVVNQGAELWCNTAKLFSAVKDVSVDFDPLAADVNGYINAGMVSTQADRGWPTAFQPEFEAALPDYLLNKAELPDILNSLDKAWDTAKAASQS